MTTAAAVPTRLSFLDGLRGLAAMQVILLHYSSAFLPAAVFGGWQALTHRTAPPWQTWFQHSPLFFFIDGYSAVYIFFIMSGYVLRLAFAAPGSLAFGAWRRLLRIGLPTAAAICIAGLLLAAWPRAHVATANATNSSLWLGALMTTPARPLAVLNDALLYSTVLGYDHDSFLTGALRLPPLTAGFDPPVWTMNTEFLGSLLCVALAALSRLGKWPLRAVLALLVIGFGCDPLVLFPIGFWLAGMRTRPRWPLGLVCLAAGLWFCRANPPPPIVWLSLRLHSWHPTDALHLCNEIAGLLIFLGVLHLRPLQIALALPPARFLGRVSFSLYLLHFPILASIGCLTFLFAAPLVGGTAAAVIALAAGLFLTIPAAALFNWAVDEPATRLSRIRPRLPAWLHRRRQTRYGPVHER